MGITILENIMKVYTYSEAGQQFADVRNIAGRDEAVIKRRGGKPFSIIFRKGKKSSFDVTGIKAEAMIQDILEAVRKSRERGFETA